MEKKFKNIRHFETLIESKLACDLKEPSSKKSKKNESLSDLELVVGVLRLLVLDFDKYSTKWNLVRLVRIIQSTKKSLVKWFALKISSLLLGLSSHDESNLFNAHFSLEQLQQLSIEVQKIFLNDPELMLNPNEDVVQTNFNKTDYDYFRLNQDGDTNFVRFDNGLKLNQNQHHQFAHSQTKLVFVESTRRNLNKLVMSLVTDQCIVVEGELSTGKTSLVEYLAEQSRNKLVKYQMDEFMDSKSLIGNYVCSEIPGEFVWKPGPLYSCVKHGHWLLLEDFDHAPVDSLCLLIDLLETKCMTTSDNKIRLDEQFRLFLTIRPSDHTNTSNNNLNFIQSIKKLCRSVRLDVLSDEEIITIICEKYASFGIASTTHLAQKLLDIYKYLDFSRPIEVGGEMVRVRDNRHLSLRDLLKVCNRIKKEKTKDASQMLMDLLSDVFECFLAFVGNKKLRDECAVKVAAKLNISREQVEALLLNKKPAFMKKNCHITCGRVRLEAEAESIRAGQTKFVYTKSALCLLEKIARCIECKEPVLLCGETGVGKTTALQHLANLLGKKISVINLNQQTETSDLLGSFKPVDIKTQMKTLKDKFVDMFTNNFNLDENRTFLNHVQTCYSKSNWKYLLRLIGYATESSIKKLSYDGQHLQRWKDLQQQCSKLEDNLDDLANKFTFQFLDGKLSEAIVNGEWIILDEINLASAETLQFLGSLLDNTESESSSIILYERGDHEPLKRHADFRLFGAMNPASDVGKRNLPANIRTRFTEIFVDELDDQNDLTLLIRSYLQSMADLSSSTISSMVQFYQQVRDEQFVKKLSNGIGMPPTYSLRTLCRALTNAATNPCNNTLVSIYDSMCLSFLTDLNRDSSLLLEDTIKTFILKSNKTKLTQLKRSRPPVEFYSNATSLRAEKLSHVNIEDYWILKGDLECSIDENFVFTKSVTDNLKRLCRVCAARLPCLIQGDTSIGKTSLIKWLACATGNRLIRINNHDHTDLAEYIGSYVMDDNNRLVFKEGLLVQAMRHGHWILLDELNLASSEVLEALNRVLDDNRELYIAESQQLIQAHPRFLLFATQNPPGKYAGRKQLSKAFKNRFIQLHYDELPDDELLLIVEKKCHLPKSYANLLIKSIHDLKTRRSQVSGIFLGKDSLITLRDLFRWARRYSLCERAGIRVANSLGDNNLSDYVDWKQYLAEQGFLLLTSRCRSQQDIKTIHACIEKSFGKKIDINEINEPSNLCRPIMNVLHEIIDYSRLHFSQYVWTPSAKRIALLAGLAYKFGEPFLLVGETGVGKTTICQILSSMFGKKLSIVNCHMHSEASDFLGSMRPVRTATGGDEQVSGLFEWVDGPLVAALKNGHDFLIDEISLADDSVLERLNSVLEEDRSLLLAENVTDTHSIRAHVNFRISATMNPSGDFGKKELSPALRNRFTEIWCPAPDKNSDDFHLILNHSLHIDNDHVKQLSISVIVDFLRWLSEQTFFKSALSIRDLNQWINFMNKMRTRLDTIKLLIHAACLVFIDSFSTDLDYSNKPRQKSIDYLTTLIQDKTKQFNAGTVTSIVADPLIDKTANTRGETQSDYVIDSRRRDEKKQEGLVQQQHRAVMDVDLDYDSTVNPRCEINSDEVHVLDSPIKFECGDFSIEKGDYMYDTNDDLVYVLESETTVKNLERVMRCMLMDSPIMLEGSPGVGKTSLVEALGRLTQNKVVRINLSEQTDLSELFGADLPVSAADASSGFQQRFEWLDGPFLLALKKGYWVILDEINLASQSVLEGLNSCFDHRSEIFISELNRTFSVDKKRTKIFACQNPYSQGGGRKGLPKSFLNRFAKVYIDKMTHKDLLCIVAKMYPIERDMLSQMIQFNTLINQEVCVDKKWGTMGSPWEFNLRDLFRWCDLIIKSGPSAHPRDFVYLIYANRFRLNKDKEKVFEIFKIIFGIDAYTQQNQLVRLSRSHIQIGQSIAKVDFFGCIDQNFVLTNSNFKHLESMLKCVEMNWMVILVGRSSTGKTCLVRQMANLLGKGLVEFSVNNATDTSDLLGGYEKTKHLKQTLNYLQSKIVNNLRRLAARNLDKLRDYFDFMYKTKNINDLDDEDLEQVKDVCNVLREQLVNLDMKNDLLVLEKLSHFEKMKFEWVDSALVKAIENGDWVLIDNANFCAPSVIDRLNPLLENNGRLQINEKGVQSDGQLVEIKKHENFRLFLSMNEQFGELSRPMRNRGCEIYLNELDTRNDIEDMFIILNSLFPLDKHFYSDKLKFADLFNIHKLAYDHWLTAIGDCDTQMCFNKSFVEYSEGKINDCMCSWPDMPQFYTNVNKIKNCSVYNFLFNYPLMQTFKMSVCSQFIESRDLNLTNLHMYHEGVLKTCNYVIVLLRNVPMGASAQVNEFVRQNLIGSCLANFIETVINGEYMNEFRSSLKELEHESQMVLDHETVDFVRQNSSLCQKLTCFSKYKHCQYLSSIFDLYIQLELFKFRVDSLYTIQNDSLYFLIENNSQLSQYKYLTLIEQFVQLFAQSVLKMSSVDDADQKENIQLSIVLIEKFYLILSSKYDQVLTMSYLKYYWNLIQINIHLIDKTSSIWSVQLKSILSIFDQNLKYDDSLYKIYYSLWSQQNKQFLTLYNDKTLCSNLEIISTFMTNNSFYSIMTCRNFSKSLKSLIKFISSKPVRVTMSRDQIETVANFVSNEQNPVDFGLNLKRQLTILLNKSYPLMLQHYLDTLNSLLNKNRQQTLLDYSSLSELIIDDLTFDLSTKCSYKNLNLFKSIEYLLSIENLNDEFISSYVPDSFESLNILSFDFLNSFMAKILLNSDQQRVDLTLDFYDLKINLIHSITKFIWSNYELLSKKQSTNSQININLLEQVSTELNFVTSEQIQDYLCKRGFDKRFLVQAEHNTYMNLLCYGIFYLFLYCPMEPLDPIEHDVLIKKNQLAMSDSQNHLNYLEHKNVVCRFKICLDHEPKSSDDQLIERLNKSIYYLIKSELENFLKQFLSFEQMSSLFCNLETNTIEQFNTWLNSTETLINKLKNYYSYSDIIAYPVRGLSLIWYAMSSMYTECRAQKNLLVQRLIQYPVIDEYAKIADQMSTMQSNDMCLIALMNIVNAVMLEPGTHVTHLVVRLCDYFRSVYFEYKQHKDQMEHVDAYKYKQYGQEKIQQEIEDQEYEEKFPNYEHNFSDFIQINILDDKTKEAKQTKKDAEIYFFDQVYDLIDKIFDHTSCTHKFLVDTFFKCYTTAIAWVHNNPSVIKNSDKNTLLSHILFSTSVNLKIENKFFDIYHDSSCEQVLNLKTCLDSLTKRIETILMEWPQNPVLIELLKIKDKIESFNLNDPLMKYLTGVELLLSRADAWQLIASRDVSLEAELKVLNQLVVEWRKLELKQWMNSCESEMDKIKKDNAFIWFFNVYSTCKEYLDTNESDENALVSTLYQFMYSSPIGQFFMRLKSIYLCHMIFVDFKAQKSASLNKILWSVWNFYTSVYSTGVQIEMTKNQSEIDKELRDFISIYKWQDTNYWSIKNSVAKSNRHFVRTIKKFKIFLKSEIDWSKLTKQLSLLGQTKLNKKFQEFVVEKNQNEDLYAFRMQKFCAKVLRKKFKNNRFNRNCAQFMQNVRCRFDELSTETRQLTNQFVSDKKNADKYKKEFKYLNQEKLKFMSDLIKKLGLMGLSYRKGQIMSQRYNNIEQCILDDKTIADTSHFNFYLCTRLYFNYKTTNASQQAANLPVEKFNGFLDHLFSLVHTQRINLTKLSININRLNSLKSKISIISNSNCLSQYKSATTATIVYSKLRTVYRKFKKLLIQIKSFYENLLNLGQSENVAWIVNEYDENVKQILDHVLNLIPDEKKSVDEIELLFDSHLTNGYVIHDREPIERLATLIQKHCRPFYEYYIECVHDLEGISIESSKLDDDVTNQTLELSSIQLGVQQAKNKILKIVETFYKKYSDYVIKDLESDHFFTSESLDQFTSDIESFQLNTLVKQIEKIIKNSHVDTVVVGLVSQLKSVLEPFSRFVNAYEQYLCQAHVKCCEMFEALVKVFDEYRNGLNVPKELEQGEDDGGENEPGEDRKFQTDDATGLGEGQGCKDVSDQIENEDQLDDAKTEQQRAEEKDKNEDDAQRVEEEKNGIEMSEDFEAKMEDVDMQEQDDDQQEKDHEQEEELDDQKADVDNAMDYLDKQLWDQEENEQEENSLDEDINGGHKLADDMSEMMAKEDNLNMTDNDEQRQFDNDQLNEEKEQEEEQEQVEEEEDKQDDTMLNEKMEQKKAEDSNENKEQDQLINEENLIEDQNDNLSENNENEQDNKQNEQLNEDTNEEEDGQDVSENNNKEKEVEKNEQENIEENKEQENRQDLIENNNKKKYQACNQMRENNQNESKSNTTNCVETSDDKSMDEDKNEDEIKNEIDLNHEAENEMKSGNGQNELSVNSSERLEAQQRDDRFNRNRKKKNENRVLQNEHDEPLDSIKDLNIVDVNQQESEMNESENEVKGATDYTHLNNQEEKFDERVYDAATDEQKKPRDRHEQETRLDEQLVDHQVHKQQDREQKKNLTAKKIDTNKEKESLSTSEEKKNEIENDDDDQSDERQNFIGTTKIERPNESLFVTLEQNLSIDINRDVVENDLAKFRERSIDHEQIDYDESLRLWLEYEAITQQLSKELCEQLRLILEPTVCSKLKGDYKTGKRLNMKRVVEYIATEYRKDKIWLRRTKPNKRDYQVVLAVDNSSSMSDNHCMQLAYETIATLTNAFTILEVGKFGLVSFGQKVDLLHNLDEHFNSDVGARILSKINFKDDRTKIAEMLDTSIGLFCNTSSNAPVSKLLIILSDGRGVFYEGIDKVKSSVQRALAQGIFIVFVILDITDKSAASIYDIKMPVYTPNNAIPTIKSYMESFPFPFYVCLREVNSLPFIMIEALKQWFDMVTRVDS